MTQWLTRLAVLLLLATAVAAPAFAQGGGASSTGTIQGRVADAQGAVLPGVTVTAISPSMIGQQTSVTSESGTYRFPAVPPGTYTLTYELAGVNTFKREGVQITLGFTANVNVELTLATLQRLFLHDLGAGVDEEGAGNGVFTRFSGLGGGDDAIHGKGFQG